MIVFPPGLIVWPPRFTHTVVAVAVLLGSDSTQACMVVPVPSGPVVNSTLLQSPFIYCM